MLIKVEGWHCHHILDWSTMQHIVDGKNYHFRPSMKIMYLKKLCSDYFSIIVLPERI